MGLSVPSNWIVDGAVAFVHCTVPGMDKGDVAVVDNENSVEALLV